MSLAHWNWHLVTFGIALAAGHRLVAKAAVVALTGQETQKELFADGDRRAQGGGHALGEGPWNSVKEIWLSMIQNATQKDQGQQYLEHL